jgi:AcrR family transcriptional regulator
MASSSPETAPERPTARRARSRRARNNDLRIDQAALTALVNDGADGFQMGAIAREAGLSSGAVYGRFENSTELAIHLWQEILWPHLLELLDKFVQFIGEDPAQPIPEFLLQECTEPSPEIRGALEILLVARRVEEIAEVVGPDLDQWVLDQGLSAERDPIGYAHVIGPLMPILGLIELRMLPTPVEMPVAGVLDLYHGVRLHRWTYVETPHHQVSPVTEPILNTQDPLRHALLLATADVMASVGVARTTVSRIARRADYTVAAIYERYATKEDLILDTAREILGATVTQGTRGNIELLTHPQRNLLITNVLRVSVDPAFARLRQLRNEMMLAGFRDELIGNEITRATQAGIEEGYQGIKDSDMADAGTALAMSAATRALITGRDLLTSLRQDLHLVDFRPVVDYVISRTLRSET